MCTDVIVKSLAFGFFPGQPKLHGVPLQSSLTLLSFHPTSLEKF